MFGQRLDLTQFQPGPEWACKLAAKYDARCRVYWKHQPKGRITYGCYAHIWRSIAIYSNTTEQTDETLMVMLHEIAHALTPGHRHDATFWAKAVELYQSHGLLEYAAKHERYAGGLKACRQALSLLQAA